MMSYHKNRMTRRVITFWRLYVTSLTMAMSAIRFLIENIFNFRAIKSPFDGSYDKQTLTLVVISYGFHETRH